MVLYAVEWNGSSCFEELLDGRVDVLRFSGSFKTAQIVCISQIHKEWMSECTIARNRLGSDYYFEVLCNGRVDVLHIPKPFVTALI